MQSYAIRSGDSLNRIAQQFNVSVADLVKANGITNPDSLHTGDRLTIPDEFRNEDPRSGPVAGDQFAGQQQLNGWQTPTPLGDQVVPARRADEVAGPVRARSGREFPTSRDGTPMFQQRDAEWSGRVDSTTAATAMATSKLSGNTITPGELDQFLDTHQGWSGNTVRPDVAAAASGLGAERQPLNLDTVNRQLDANRPVVMGVNDNQAVTLTRRERDAQGQSTYFANDPSSGREVRFREQGGRLVPADDNHAYRSNGRMTTFTGGRTTRIDPNSSRPVTSQIDPRSNDAQTRGRRLADEQRPVLNGNRDRRLQNDPRLQSPQGLRARNAGRGLNLQSELSSPDSTLSVAIGNAEGTRTRNGGRTRAYGSHIDPGNRRRNLGTFSYQAHQNPNVRTPEQADQVQLARLRRQIPAYEAAARRAGLDPNNPRLQAAYFDLWNQSPRMAQRFLDRLPQTMRGREPTVENLVRARTNAAFDDRGRFTSTGLRNPARAERDQRRRMMAMEAVLRARGAV